MAKPKTEDDEDTMLAKSSLVSPNGPVPEENESPEDEAAESPEQQAKEDAEGTEQHGEKSNAQVPEAFQKMATAAIQSANSQQLAFLSNLIADREKTLNKSKTKSERSGTFDTEGMPG